MGIRDSIPMSQVYGQLRQPAQLALECGDLAPLFPGATGRAAQSAARSAHSKALRARVTCS